MNRSWWRFSNFLHFVPSFFFFVTPASSDAEICRKFVSFVPFLFPIRLHIWQVVKILTTENEIMRASWNLYILRKFNVGTEFSLIRLEEALACIVQGPLYTSTIDQTSNEKLKILSLAENVLVPMMNILRCHLLNMKKNVIKHDKNTIIKYKRRWVYRWINEHPHVPCTKLNNVDR